MFSGVVHPVEKIKKIKVIIPNWAHTVCNSELEKAVFE